jgi:methane monooxygenase PmoA-like
MNRREFIAAAALSVRTSRLSGATSVIVEAGQLDRRDVVVSFSVPAGVDGKSTVLRDDAGKTIPLQIDADRASFVLSDLKAGKSKRYQIQQSSTSPAIRVRVAADERLLRVTSGNERIFDFRLKPELPEPGIKDAFRRAGYMHPVYTPAGRIVTDDYPSDHPHQHGIMFAWTKTEFEGRHPDFWNMGSGTGSVEFDGIVNSWSGPVHSGFTARLRYVDLSAPKPVTALNELWAVRAYAVRSGQKPYTIFDIISTQQTAGNSPLLLPDYRYGGIAVRGHRNWRKKENVIFLTSEGKDRIAGDDTRVRWCSIDGNVDGTVVGIAAFGHPDNFRAPQPVRIHPDDPYFNFSPSKLGDWRIDPGKPYVSRYRFVAFDGPADSAELDRLWNDYASPPKVTVGSR